MSRSTPNPLTPLSVARCSSKMPLPQPKSRILDFKVIHSSMTLKSDSFLASVRVIFSGIELWDLPNALRYPMPVNYTEKEVCGVGRIRVDHVLKHGLAIWVVGDQLWKGAALNALQIAESLVERKCLRYM